MKNVELDKNDITKDINVEFAKKEWKGIGTKRICPKCHSEIEYRDKWSFIYSVRDNKICKICSCKRMSAINKELGKLKGLNNPFYGKKHSDETKRKMSGRRPNIEGVNNPLVKWLKKDLENRENYRELFTGEKNGMFGKHHTKEALEKISFHSKGKNNPMFGKPAPNGSGNGWANWYKGFHFRSLRELQYYISEIDEKGILFESAQKKSFRIPYTSYDGTDRSYQPDFLIDGRILVEVKPINLWNTTLVKLKKEAAEKFCKENNLEYKLVDVKTDSKLLKDKYLNGEIKFVEKYKERFEKYAGIKR
jgi:hypothetical protein